MCKIIPNYPAEPLTAQHCLVRLLNTYMKLKSKYIDELIDIRAEARTNKNYALSDEIRNYLDSKRVFCFDGVNGQEVYHIPANLFKEFPTRQKVEDWIKSEIRAEKYLMDG